MQIKEHTLGRTALGFPGAPHTARVSAAVVSGSAPSPDHTGNHLRAEHGLEGQPGLSGRVLNPKLVGGEWEEEPLGQVNPTSFCYNIL